MILSPTQQHENALSNFSPTLPSFFDISDKPLRSLDALQGLLLILPARDKTDQLIDRYVHDFEPMYHSLHKPTFFDQINDLWCSIQHVQSSAPRPDQFSEFPIDVLSCVFSFLACAGDLVPSTYHITIGTASDSSSVQSTIARWQKAFLDCLNLSDFVGKPSLVGLQGILAFFFAGAHRSVLFVFI